MKSLAQWLQDLEQLHPKSIAMGLDRIAPVYARLGVRPQCPTIIVAGTNGKGSVCAMLESILRTDGYGVGLYTSPNLLRFNERIKIRGVEVGDAALITAFERVEAARQGTPLTYFEFGTLAAFVLFHDAALDCWVLEVGLGGRLDATNLIDADCAVLTSVGLDHTEYLGPTRDDIAREKLGVMRAGGALVCGESDLPASAQSLIAQRALSVFLQRGVAYTAQADGPAQWLYTGPDGARSTLPYPALRGAFQIQNAATALAALHTLRGKLPVRAGAIRSGLLTVDWPGRFQVLPGRPTVVLDAAHNPHAALVLADALGGMGYHPESFAVFGMLVDKDVAGVIAAVKHRFTGWYVAPTRGPRGRSAESVHAALVAAGVPDAHIKRFPSVESALVAVQQNAQELDRIVVFGSFHILAEAMEHLESTRHRAGQA
jgi:dihydrofolate synthase / folylpolyglutamate synthase